MHKTRDGASIVNPQPVPSEPPVGRAPAADEMMALSEVVERLVHALEPVRIYLFGSQARADAHADSDYDLLVVVSSSEEPGYRRDQDARRVLGDVSLPLDVLVWTRAEFDDQAGVPGSLPATVLREGPLLYAA